MITVTFDPRKQKPQPRTGPYGLNGVMLQPGANQVSDKQFAKLQSHPQFERLQQWGAVTLSPEAATASPEPKVVEVIDSTKGNAELPRLFTSLSGMTVAESEPLIEQTTDLEQLKYWQKESERKTLTELLEDRIAELSS